MILRSDQESRTFQTRETVKMNARLLLVIAALAACGVSLQLKRRYYFYYEAKTQPEALDYCREKHTDLATITGMDDVNTLVNTVDSVQLGLVEGNQLAWIGLYDDVNSWRWSLSDQSFYGTGETNYRNWLTIIPVNLGGERACTTIGNLGTWNDVSCSLTLKPVCSNVTGSDATFFLIDTSMTWSEAQSYCREHHTDLASVRNFGENLIIQGLVPLLSEVWIGLYRDSWKWYDGSESTFMYWSPALGDPNNLLTGETCVSADFLAAGAWMDWPCGYQRSFICYTRGITRQVIQLSVQKATPTLDLNNPAVMANILEQLRQKLRDDGLSENISLSWRKQPGRNVFQKQQKEEAGSKPEPTSCADVK